MGCMDPVTLIVAALAAGAAKGASETVATGIKDAYQGLKQLVLRRFGGDRKAFDVLAEYEADPDTYEKPLAKQLQAAGAADDTELIVAAQELLSRADPAGAQVGKYNVQVSGRGQIGAIGDHANVTMGNVPPNPQQGR